VCMYVYVYVCMGVCMYVYAFLIINLLPACSSTLMRNTTSLFCLSPFSCYIYSIHVCVCHSPVHILSNSIEFINWVNCFIYLFTRSLFSLGQVSCFVVLRVRASLFFCRLWHSYIGWSTVWFPVSHGHSGESIILNLCR